MVHLILKKLHRGATTKLLISIFKTKIEVMDLKTEHINLYNLVEVILNFKGSFNNYDVMPFVQMRKKENAQYDAVHVQVTGTNFDEQFFCADGWVEVKMSPKPYNKSQTHCEANITYKTFSYYMEVNITVTEIMPAVPLLAYKELYEDTDFTDVDLQADDGNVAVHKTILLANSDVFKAMVRGEWSEKIDGQIKMNGMTVQTLKDLKAYMYLGVLPDEGLQSLLVVAARYLMNKLKADCSAKLVNTMRSESFEEIVNLACQNQIPELVKALVVRIPENVLNNIYQLKTEDKENEDGEK